MVVLDTCILLLFLEPRTNPPLDQQTGAPLERAAERIDNLVKTLSQQAEPIIIPTPVLSEALVYAGRATNSWIEKINKSSAFRLEAFEQRAAIEAADAIAQARKRNKSKKDSDASWTKVKFDRQIVAIAKSRGASVIYSDDKDIEKFAKGTGIQVIKTRELPLPPESAQPSLPF